MVADSINIAAEINASYLINGLLERDWQRRQGNGKEWFYRENENNPNSTIIGNTLAEIVHIDETPEGIDIEYISFRPGVLINKPINEKVKIKDGKLDHQISPAIYEAVFGYSSKITNGNGKKALDEDLVKIDKRNYRKMPLESLFPKCEEKPGYVSPNTWNFYPLIKFTPGIATTAKHNKRYIRH
ncbi:MAG: hypothetical protein NT129_02115 [Candidatus Aenigmarchaeota archaeon]|nr:hypothetical protein [Candidatus Aenigmarchaeota archaeon]